LARGAAARVPRQQVNLSFGRSSPLLAALVAAERDTGMGRARIVRGVLDQFLEEWIAERARDRAIRVRRVARLRREATEEGVQR